MRITSIFFLLLFIALSSCKKKATIYATMTVQVNGDSSWTTTDVTTENDQNKVVYINGSNIPLDKSVSLVLNGYEPGNLTYAIHASGYSPTSNQSQAEYTSGGNASPASSGQIVITNTTTKTIEGTFDFEGGSVHVTGTFTAPIP